MKNKFFLGVVIFFLVTFFAFFFRLFRPFVGVTVKPVGHIAAVSVQQSAVLDVEAIRNVDVKQII